MDDQDAALISGQLIISIGLEADGQEVFTLRDIGELSIIQKMGMLELAKATILDEARDYEDD